MTTTDVDVSRSREDSGNYLGHSMDVDAHEMAPIHLWPEIFGESGVEGAKFCSGVPMMVNAGTNSLDRPEVVADILAATLENVWTERGVAAPGASDFGRRLEVMDVMGIERQLVFPGFGLVGMFMTSPNAPAFFGLEQSRIAEMAQVGRHMIEGHNRWCGEVTRAMGGRGRPTAILYTDSFDQMMKDAETLLADGVLAFWIANGAPPAGMSPADARLDPFWALCAEAKVPVTFHIGGEFEFLRSSQWDVNVPAFEPTHQTTEASIQPYWGTTVSFASENFLAAMTLGGVFERHPELRVGSLEVGANWIGPLAERMDLWAAQFPKRLGPILSMKPSDYINRNVRVTPFHFEDVASYFERFPHIQDSYCYSSDYPHIEGGRYSKDTLSEKLSGCSEEIRRKFFRTNGEWLMPDQ